MCDAVNPQNDAGEGLILNGVSAIPYWVGSRFDQLNAMNTARKRMTTRRDSGRGVCQ
jgi:hypothetical protein